MYGIGMQELLLILVIVVLIFGSKKLPEIGGGLGKAIRNFKRASSEPDEIDITPKDEKTTQPIPHSPLRFQFRLSPCWRFSARSVRIIPLLRWRLAATQGI